jgi:hypothetical protein
MRFDSRKIFLVTITIVSGLIVILGYFTTLPIIVNLRDLFLRWSIIISGVAIVIGVINLMQVHWKKVKIHQSGWLFSVVLLVSLFVTIIVAGFFGPTASLSQWLYDYIQVPIETSLLALLTVVLIYALARLLNRRITLFPLIFIATVIIVLVGTVSIPGIEVPIIGELRSWLITIWGTAGARGILLGVALGTIATGLRILMGADRPYGG